MKATAVAPANIAFIKYWGRRDARFRIPYNPSISMNLSACTTTTTIEFSDAFTQDGVKLEGQVFSKSEVRRVIKHIDRIREKAGVKTRVKVITKNSFPKSTGIASSSSGFAALTVAAVSALGLSLSETELTELARLGSGSACRSIPDGFVKWEGEIAYSLYPADYWDLRDIVVIVGDTGKDVSSSAGHDTVETSPFFQKRLQDIPDRIIRIEKALKERNFQKLGEAIEEECLDMHHVMQTQTPPLMYWTDETKMIMEQTAGWRKEELPVYFTIDAGPNVHLICEGLDEQKLIERLVGRKIIINKPARGARLI